MVVCHSCVSQLCVIVVCHSCVTVVCHSCVIVVTCNSRILAWQELITAMTRRNAWCVVGGTVVKTLTDGTEGVGSGPIRCSFYLTTPPNKTMQQNQTAWFKTKGFISGREAVLLMYIWLCMGKDSMYEWCSFYLDMPSIDQTFTFTKYYHLLLCGLKPPICN